MFPSLASLILDAIGLLLRRIEVVLPPPLQQMAPTLGRTQSVHTVSIITQAMRDTVHMSRAELVIVRRGEKIGAHMLQRTFAGGHTSFLETTSTEAGEYYRQDRQGTWLWSEPPGPPQAQRLAAFESLTTEVLWRELDDEQINGQACRAYEALRTKRNDAWTQVLLWVRKDSLQPVEMLSLSLRKGTSFESVNPVRTEALNLEGIDRTLPRPQTLSSQMVTWSQWDDPTLSIPSV